MANVQAPRGTHDIFNHEFSSFEKIYHTFAQQAAHYGFKGIETPIFESLKVFDRSLGDSSDIVSKEMYVFEDRGGEKLSLRPEGTAGIVRAFISNSWQRDLPLKLFYRGPMFRYERPQKGRYRQFHQIGVEALGIENPLIDVEVIALGHSLLKALGIDHLCRLEINSIGDSESRSSYREALVKYYSENKGQLSEDSLRRLEQNPLRILDSKDKNDIELNKNAPKLSAYLSEASHEKFNRVIELLSDIKLDFEINEKLVRGLDYYNDVVFEFKTSELGAQDAVLSGGRYDSLVETMGGPNTPGVGFAAGVERLSLLMKETKSKQPDVVFVPMGTTGENLSLSLSLELRSLQIQSDFIYSGNFSKRMKKADKLGAAFVILIGENEIAEQVAVIKNLQSGNQDKVPFHDIASYLQSKLNVSD